MLELRLLGGYEVLREGRAVPGVAQARCGVVLAYLALARREVPRGVLAAALWPDSEDSQARTNLRRELHQLRQAGWEPGEWRVDVHLLEDALARGDDAAAVELYRGELLPGFFQDWVLRERERWHSAVGEVLARLADTPSRARALVRHDPLCEQSHRALISLLLKAGDRAAAKAALQECQAVLARELGVEASEETRRLLEPPEPRATPTSGPGPREARDPSEPRLVALPPLVGRAVEWARMRSWWESGSPAVLLLEGEPGIGKTRLLTELEAHAQAEGWRVLTARAHEAERGRVHGLLLDALGERGELRAEDLVTALAELGDGLLILDDVQWADESSLALLHYASRLLAPLRVAWALRTGTDDGPASAQIRRLVREGRLERISLTSLKPGDTAALAGRPLEDAQDFWRRCGGNPLYALELGRSQGTGGLAELIRARLEDLPKPERELLSWLAALGTEVSLAELGVLAEKPEAELDGLAEGLERTGLLRPLGAGYIFGHDVVREVAYESLSAPRRRLLHLRIARHLERPAEVARHAALGGDHELALTAYRSAAKHLLRALAYREARDQAREGWRLARDRGALEAELELLAVWVSAGAAPSEVRELQARVEELARVARESGQAEHEANCHALLAWLQFGEDSLERVQASSRKMAETVMAAGPQAQAQGLARSGYCLAAIGRELARAEALLSQARSLGGEEIYELQIGFGLLRWHQGQLDESRDWLRKALRHSRQAGAATHASFCLARLGLVALEAGDWAEARELAEELTRLARQRGDLADEGCARGLQALADYLETRTGSLEEVERDLCQLGSRRFLAHLLLVASEHDERGGHPDSARWARMAARHAEELHDEDLAVRARALAELGAPAPRDPAGAGEAPAFADAELSFRTRAVLDRVAAVRAGMSPA